MIPFVLGALLALLPQAPVTRADLARAYQRFERAYAAARLAPEQKRELNRAFDRATLAFFGGQGQAVLDGLEALSRELGAPVPAQSAPEQPYDWDGLRTEMLLAINALAVDGPPLEQAVASVRARANLLRSRPAPTDSAQFLADRPALAREIDGEIALLRRGDDPYRRRVGDLWRVVKLPKGELAVRVYAPALAAKDDALPLVIALHGAGGDENMFLEGYGAGRIRALADQHGFLVACPRVGFGLAPETLDLLLRALVYDYAIDPKRIGLLGHSLGAGIAAGIAAREPARFSALACFSGGPRAASERLPPTWISVGALDPLADPAQLESAARELAGRGLAVQFETLPDLGHTLIVGERLDAAVAYLLGHRLP